MGRAGRVAPRICSTLELRTHASSLTVSLPATTSKAAVPASPPSPGTPVQEHAPACVRPALQAWPQEALQVVQRQMEALRSQSSEVSEPSTRKRELECSESQEPNSTLQGDSFEEALQTQSALPEDWEQFLNLKTGQFYYFHWSSCKRAKQDPRMLVRQADVTVQAHLLGAHIRGELSIESPSPANDETEAGNEAGCSPPDVCERTSGVCSVAPERCAERELGNGGSMCGSSDKEEQATNVCEKEDRKSQNTVMVVSGCQSCSTFVMLCLSSPACPSCGASAHSGENGIR